MWATSGDDGSFASRYAIRLDVSRRSAHPDVESGPDQQHSLIPGRPFFTNALSYLVRGLEEVGIDSRSLGRWGAGPSACYAR
jgi:hypothetical protein